MLIVCGKSKTVIYENGLKVSKISKKETNDQKGSEIISDQNLTSLFTTVESEVHIGWIRLWNQTLAVDEAKMLATIDDS